MKWLFFMLFPMFFGYSQKFPWTGDKIAKPFKSATIAFDKDKKNQPNWNPPFALDFKYNTFNGTYNFKYDNFGNLIYEESDYTYTDYQYSQANQLLEKKITSKTTKNPMRIHRNSYIDNRIMDSVVFIFVPAEKDRTIERQHKFHETQYRYKGDLLVEESTISFSEKSDKQTITSTTVYFYDEGNNQSAIEYYNMEEKLVEKIEYLDKESFVKYVFKDDKIRQTTKQFIKSGKVLKRLCYDSKDQLIYQHDLVYDKQLNLLQFTNTTDGLQNTDIYEYSFDKNIIKTVSKFSNGKFVNKRGYEYDIHGNVVKSVFLDETDKVIYTYTIAYQY